MVRRTPGRPIRHLSPAGNMDLRSVDLERRLHTIATHRVNMGPCGRHNRRENMARRREYTPENMFVL